MRKAWQTWQRSHTAWIAAGVLAGSIVIILIAVWLVPGSSSLDAPAAALDGGVMPGEFFNMVIFGVDDLQVESPAVGAVWIGTFEIMDKGGVLMGLPRTFQLTNSQSIEQAFAWSPQNGLDPTFLDGVEATLGLSFDTALIMDERCFQASIDFIGGIPMDDGQSLDGPAALALHKLSANDPWMALEVQAKILAGASLRLADLGEAPDLSPLLELTPDHCWLTVSDVAAVEMLLRMLPITEGSIQVDTLPSTN